MIVDPHTHTTVSSSCSSMQPEELVAAALQLGLGAIAVTEHGRIEGAEVTREIGSRKGLKVFCGVEVYTADGDMLVYGVFEDIEPWDSAIDLARWVHDRGGLVVAAHPFRGRYGLHGLVQGDVGSGVLEAVDAIETANGADSQASRDAAVAAAAKLGKPGFGGSDSHRATDVGRCVTLCERSVSTDNEFMEEIRAGRIKGTTLGQALGGPTGWWAERG